MCCNIGNAFGNRSNSRRKNVLGSSLPLGIVMDNGVLFRGSRESKVRESFIKQDLIEAVIGLPANLFANTGSPGCLLIVNRKKSKARNLLERLEDYQEDTLRFMKEPAVPFTKGLHR